LLRITASVAVIFPSTSTSPYLTLLQSILPVGCVAAVACVADVVFAVVFAVVLDVVALVVVAFVVATVVTTACSFV